MFVTIDGERYDFVEMEITVLEKGIHNLFEAFEKKTLQEIVEQKKYTHLQEYVYRHYVDLLDLPAGVAIKRLKDAGDLFYRQFLNNYGDLMYSRFTVDGDDQLLRKNGVYTIVVGDELVFCGGCARSFKERFNQHIGSIYAKGCFRDGTATHCHINSNITMVLAERTVRFAVCPVADKQEMNRLKNAIIKRFEPEWNLRSNKDVVELMPIQG